METTVKDGKKSIQLDASLENERLIWEDFKRISDLRGGIETLTGALVRQAAEVSQMSKKAWANVKEIADKEDKEKIMSFNEETGVISLQRNNLTV